MAARLPFLYAAIWLRDRRKMSGTNYPGCAKEHMLDWHTVKELDKRYMEEQLKKAGKPAPRVIGIDEVSIKKRHTYRIVVSDLERRRAIWLEGRIVPRRA